MSDIRGRDAEEWAPLAAKDHEIAALRSALADAESREASLCDLLNSWARESGVQEASRTEDAKAVADRLWAKHSGALADKTRECEGLKAETEQRWRDFKAGADRILAETSRMADLEITELERQFQADIDTLTAAALGRVTALEGALREVLPLNANGDCLGCVLGLGFDEHGEHVIAEYYEGPTMCAKPYLALLRPDTTP